MDPTQFSLVSSKWYNLPKLVETRQGWLLFDSNSVARLLFCFCKDQIMSASDTYKLPSHCRAQFKIAALVYRFVDVLHLHASKVTRIALAVSTLR